MKKGWLLVFLFLTTFATQGLAHEAEETSVGITLRDQVVEVRLNADLTSWIQNITGLALRRDHAADLEPLLLLAANNLKQSVLQVGEAKVPLEIVQFPQADAIIHDAEHGHGDHLRSTIIMRGALTAPPAGVVTMIVPRELGPVIMSFSQPKTAWVAAGSAGVFQLERGRADRSPTRPIALPWIFAAAAIFAVLAIGFGLHGIRKSRVAS